MNYWPQKFWSWGQKEDHSSPIKFWVQGKNDWYFSQHFHIFLMIFWYILMYFATYKKFGAPFILFGKILQIFTITMVKNEKFWPRLWKQSCLFMKNEWFCFYSLGQNFSFLTMLIVKNCNILPKWKNNAPNFFNVAQYMKMY